MNLAFPSLLQGNSVFSGGCGVPGRLGVISEESCVHPQAALKRHLGWVHLAPSYDKELCPGVLPSSAFWGTVLHLGVGFSVVLGVQDTQSSLLRLSGVPSFSPSHNLTYNSDTLWTPAASFLWPTAVVLGVCLSVTHPTHLQDVEMQPSTYPGGLLPFSLDLCNAFLCMFLPVLSVAFQKESRERDLYGISSSEGHFEWF